LQETVNLEHLPGNCRRRLHGFEIFNRGTFLQVWDVELGESYGILCPWPREDAYWT
jgi:hypothetical protein